MTYSTGKLLKVQGYEVIDMKKHFMQNKKIYRSCLIKPIKIFCFYLLIFLYIRIV